MGTPNFRPIGLILAILCPKTQKNYLNGHVSRRDLAQIAIIQSLTSTTLVCVHNPPSQNPPVKIPQSKSPEPKSPGQNPPRFSFELESYFDVIAVFLMLIPMKIDMAKN